jgi:peroxiredoxin
MAVVKNIVLSSMLVTLFMLVSVHSVRALEVGDKAPDFDLDSTQGGKLKLSSLQGKQNVILQFYVLDFTPT